MTVDNVMDLADAIKGIDNSAEHDNVVARIGVVCADFYSDFDWTLWWRWCKDDEERF